MTGGAPRNMKSVSSEGKMKVVGQHSTGKTGAGMDNAQKNLQENKSS